MVRGRKANLDLPLTPALIQQREFREKRANEIKSLKDENAKLSTHNAELQQQNEHLHARLNDMALQVEWQKREMWGMVRALEDARRHLGPHGVRCDPAGRGGEGAGVGMGMVGGTVESEHAGGEAQRQGVEVGQHGQGLYREEKGVRLDGMSFERSASPASPDGWRNGDTGRAGCTTSADHTPNAPLAPLAKRCCRPQTQKHVRQDAHRPSRLLDHDRGPATWQVDAIESHEQTIGQSTGPAQACCGPDTYARTACLQRPIEAQTLSEHAPATRAIAEHATIGGVEPASRFEMSRKRTRDDLSPASLSAERTSTARTTFRSACMPNAVEQPSSTTGPPLDLLPDSATPHATGNSRIPTPPYSASLPSSRALMARSNADTMSSASPATPTSPILTSDLRLPFKEDVCCMGIVSCEPDAYTDT